MLKTYSGTQYILRHPSGNGELLERYDTVEAAIKGKEEAQKREEEYRKENGFTILKPSDYVIVKSTWSRVVDIDAEDNHRFISYSLNEVVIPEE